AVPCTRYAQRCGQRDLLGRIRHVRANDGVSARRRRGSTGAVGRAARVVDHVGPRVLVAGRIRLDHVPGEQREHLVETRGTGQIGVVEVGVAAVAEAAVGGCQGGAGLDGDMINTAVMVV